MILNSKIIYINHCLLDFFCLHINIITFSHHNNKSKEKKINGISKTDIFEINLRISIEIY